MATIIVADLDNVQHQQWIIQLESALEGPGRQRYGYDGVSPERTSQLQEGFIAYLKERRAIIFIATEDETKAVGIAICELHMSTWAMKPVLNLHDLFVYEDRRNDGVGSELLDALEAYAELNGCCRVNCETSWGNLGARRLYFRRGYLGCGFTADGSPIAFADGSTPREQMTIQMKKACARAN